MGLKTFVSNLIHLGSRDLRGYNLEDPNTPLFQALVGDLPSSTGLAVTERNAMKSTTVLACVRVISESIAGLPLHVYERLPEGGKRRATDHPLYSLLHDRPNPYMSSFTFRELMSAHVLLWGNAYAEIEIDRWGDIVALWPLAPANTRPVLESATGALTYKTRIQDVEYTLLPEQVLHIPGLGDGIKGVSVISWAKETIGLDLAARGFGARFYGNNATPGGVLQTDKKLDNDARERLKIAWNTAHQGIDNAHRVAVLEEGLKWEQTGVSPQDAQALDSRKFSVEDICRIYRVPPHKVASLDKATFSNIEQQSIEFVTDTLRPWLVRFEQAYNWRLFLPRERQTFFAEHLVDGLLRGDIAARYAAYALGRQNGWLNADEIREIENMNPEPDGQGKIYLLPLNMVPADQVVGGQTGASGGGAPGSPTPTTGSRTLDDEERSKIVVRIRKNIARAYAPIFKNTCARIVRREMNDVMAAAKRYLDRRDLPEFLSWLDGFYRDHVAWAKTQVTPVYTAVAAAMRTAVSQELGTEIKDTPTLQRFGSDYVDALAKRHSEQSLGQLRAVASEADAAGSDVIEALSERLDEWQERRPVKETGWETVRSENAFTKAAYTVAGVSRIRWVKYGKSCPHCDGLDGQVVAISGSFLTKGQISDPDGPHPLTVETNIGHPPAHEGCDCGIMASM